MEKSEKVAWLSLLVNAGFVGTKSFLAAFSGSLAIKADAIHSVSDVVSSAVTLTGIRIARRQARGFPYGLYKVENLVALGTDARVLRVNELRGRGAGRYKFVELNVTLRIDDFEQAHQVSQELEERIKARLENVDRVLIHYEPRKKDALTVGIPVCEDRRTISERLGEAPLFRFVRMSLQDGTVLSDAMLRNPHTGEDKGKGINVSHWLLRAGIDVLLVLRDLGGRGPLVLGNAGAEVRLVSDTDADDALRTAGAAKDRR